MSRSRMACVLALGGAAEYLAAPVPAAHAAVGTGADAHDPSVARLEAAGKATWTFRVTVPAGKTVVANGRLIAQVTRHGKSTFVWNEPLPMATYLATTDIGDWIIKTGVTPGGIPQTVAVDPTLQAALAESLDRYWNTTAEATDLWSETFGPYPFDSTSAIVDNATYQGTPLGFSLETQTRPGPLRVPQRVDDRA